MNRAAAAGRMRVEKETRLSALINGNGEAGMLVLSRAMEVAVEKAQAHGFGIVGTHHTATSTGALGYYAEKVRTSRAAAILLQQRRGGFCCWRGAEAKA